MSVGAAGSVFAEAFVIGHVIDALDPAHVDFLLPWIQMALRGACGGVVVKLFLRFADARDMASTVVSGAIGSMQVFCSFGFEFTKSLELSAIMSGEFGCTSFGCYATLFVFGGFAAAGAVSQFKQFMVEKAMEAGTFEPKNKMDELSAFMNEKLKVIMEINQVLLDASEDHSPEEMAELAKQHMVLLMSCAQVFSFVVCVMSGLTVFMEMFELFVGIGIPSGFLSWVTLLVMLCGIFSIAAGAHGLVAFRTPESEGDRKRDVMERGLYLCVLTVPLALILMVVFATTIHSDFVRAYLDLESIELQLDNMPGVEEVAPTLGCAGLCNSTGANATAAEEALEEAATFGLSDLLGLLTVSLAYLAASLGFAIYTMSKALGGWLYIAIKTSTFFTYVVLVYGALVATAGYHIDSAEFMGSVNDARAGKFVVNPYTSE